MDKPEKARSHPNVITIHSKMIPCPPGTRGKRMHVLEAEARRRHLLLLGTALLAVLALGVAIGRFLMP